MSAPLQLPYSKPVHQPGATFRQGIPVPVSVTTSENSLKVECKNKFLASLFVTKMKNEFEELAVLSFLGNTVTIALTADAVKCGKTAEDLKTVLDSVL